MARQVLPIVGAVAGFVISGGNPYGAQIGFAVGSMIGNAVDPIEMQGRKLGDSPTQVAAEGGARAIVYGKGCIRATCIIERGGRRVIKQRDRSGGKGGGPTTINERALWTFAIGLGEPVGSILRIWENEKLVYDVTEASSIPEDTSQFAEKFRFYAGSEDQLPDPALEALHGVGNTPYYRGTAYMVFPQYDLTDFGETVPTYRVEVATLVEIQEVQRVVAFGTVNPTSEMVTASPDGITWAGGTYAWPGANLQDAAATGGRVIVWSFGSAWYSDDITSGWTLSSGGMGNSTGDRNGAALGDVVLVPGGVNDLRRSIDRGASFSTVAALNRSNHIAMRPGLALSATLYRTYASVSNDDGATWSVAGVHGITLSSGGAIGTDGESFMLGGGASGAPAIKSTDDGNAWLSHALPSVAATRVTAVAGARIGGVSVWVVGTDNGEVYSKIGSSPFILCTVPVSAETTDIVFNGSVFVLGVIDGYILTSEDGVTWASRTQPLNRFVQILASPSPGAPAQVADLIPLYSVIESIHARAGQSSEDYDASAAADMIRGVVIESTVTAAEAINSVIGSHFIDPSDYDGKIRYIPRGAAVVLTLTEDDLIDEPDEAQRNNAIEYPKKVHFLGQRADLAYASSKSTSARYSDDAKVVGEITIGSPETYDEGIAPAEVAVKLHKVLWTEAEGEREWMITDNYLGLVPTDNVGLSYRGELVRCRILNIEDTPGQRKLRMIRDRQSAYTANLTEVPNPPPVTPPQSSVVAPTVMAFIDTSALTDNADTLHYLVALSGANDNWAGAALQQQLGGTFQSIDSTTLNSIMGVLQNTVTDAAPWYTDTTNQVVVRLYTDDELESITDTEFLSNGGAFFLSWEDSGQTQWEIMQFRDAIQDSNGDWVLSHLMRGRKNTPTAEHPPGATFVWIDPAILREAAQTAWLGTVLTHRAVSNGQSPELAPIQNNEYVGNSQREWTVANLLLSRPTGTTVGAEAIPRHRFGTSMNPIRSINWDGYRWTATDGANTINRDGASDIETFDTTGWASPVTVTVAQLNRLTGAGPSVSEVIP